MKRIGPRWPEPVQYARRKFMKRMRPPGHGAWPALGERGEYSKHAPGRPRRWAGLYDRSWRESHRVGKSRPGRRQRRGQSKPMGRGKR